jgi:hypothetical protein
MRPWPVSERIKPSTIRRRVDFPHPLGPTAGGVLLLQREVHVVEDMKRLIAALPEERFVHSDNFEAGKFPFPVPCGPKVALIRC